MKPENLKQSEHGNHENCGRDDRETIDDLVSRCGASEPELREIIAYLIRHRELIRDAELFRLEKEAERIIEALRDNEREQTIETVQCFKEILALQQRLIRENDQPGDRREAEEAGSR